ncbi:MAG: 50S ribosomal protein L9 [Candidatus Gracilibacteria bacterium]|jgi:large subunit ribosomal protein L9|nr:50S ribosomal protein L9 [Candidatus Gracilibacteria bacterium]
MKVVLNKDVSKLGFKGEVLDVKPGFFRNFLAPRLIADVLTKARAKVVNARKDKMVMKKQQVLDNAKTVMEKVSGKTITVKAKANDKGVLFASFSIVDLISAVEKEFSVRLDPSFVKMEALKELGNHEVQLSLGDLKGNLFVNIKNV